MTTLQELVRALAKYIVAYTDIKIGNYADRDILDTTDLPATLKTLIETKKAYTFRNPMLFYYLHVYETVFQKLQNPASEANKEIIKDKLSELLSHTVTLFNQPNTKCMKIIYDSNKTAVLHGMKRGQESKHLKNGVNTTTGGIIKEHLIKPFDLTPKTDIKKFIDRIITLHFNPEIKDVEQTYTASTEVLTVMTNLIDQPPLKEQTIVVDDVIKLRLQRLEDQITTLSTQLTLLQASHQKQINELQAQINAYKHPVTRAIMGCNQRLFQSAQIVGSAEGGQRFEETL